MTRPIRSTTIIGVRRKGQVALGGDGQVTYADTILKAKARKVRKMYKNSVLAGFAGTAADAFTLFEKFETRLDEFNGNLSRAAVELAKEWRTDRFLRRLEAQLAVLNKNQTFLISGTGDVIEPDDNVVALGSGGPYALAAARALVKHTDLDAEKIVKESLTITAAICIYTNANFVIEVL